jgi:hypothetical protein
VQEVVIFKQEVEEQEDSENLYLLLLLGQQVL